MAGRLHDAIAIINDVEQSKVESTVGEASAVLERLHFPICPVHLCHRAPFETAINAGRASPRPAQKARAQTRSAICGRRGRSARAAKKLKKVG